MSSARKGGRRATISLTWNPMKSSVQSNNLTGDLWWFAAAEKHRGCTPMTTCRFWPYEIHSHSPWRKIIEGRFKKYKEWLVPFIVPNGHSGGMMYQLATETSRHHKAYLAKPLVRHSMVSLFVSCKDHALRPATCNQSSKVQPCVCYKNQSPNSQPQKKSPTVQPQEKNSFKISQVGVFGNFLPRITNLPTFYP